MATTRLIAMHISKGKTVAQCLQARTAYAVNPDKTEGGALVSSFACDPHTADAEFALAKREYFEITGRERANEVIAYQVRQSFKPGEVTPEEANQLGCELARRFLKDRHAWIVATHTDKKHIHNHIIWNSTALDCTHKFRNFLGSGRAVARLSDQICMEHALSVIVHPQGKGKTYDKWLGEKARPSQREQLRSAIDAALEKKPADFEALLRLLTAAGWEVKRGKQISLRGIGEQRFKRMDTLGEEYSVEALWAVLAGTRSHTPRRKRGAVTDRLSQLIDIQAKMQAGKGAGYERWAKVFNVKQMAKTINYLSEHGLHSYDDLQKRVQETTERYHALAASIRTVEKQMKETGDLKAQIIQYAKTKEVYAAYRVSGYAKRFLKEHEQEIRLHQAAKRAFDSAGKDLPRTVKGLQAEYEKLLTQKKEQYAAYRQARADMRELLTVKANMDKVLSAEREHESSTKKHLPQR